MSLRAGGRGESGPRLLLLENRRKIEPKEIPSCLIPRLLVVITRQLEILVTTVGYPVLFTSEQYQTGVSYEQTAAFRLVTVTIKKFHKQAKKSHNINKETKFGLEVFTGKAMSL